MKIKFFCNLLILIPFFLNAQYNCGDNRLPDSRVLYQTLLQRPVKIYPRKFLLGCNVNDTIKNRLLALLNPIWSKEEVENYIMRNINEDFNSQKFEQTAKSIAKGNDSLYKISVDSIVNFWKGYYTQKIIENNMFSVDVNTLYIVSFLDFKEAIPTIEKYFNTYDTNASKLALARLGNRKFQLEIIKKCKPDISLNDRNWVENFKDKGFKLWFMATQESIYELHRWVDTSKTFSKTMSQQSKSANWVLMFVKDIILNEDFQVKINSMIDKSEIYELTNTDMSILVFCKKWLIENKGKYIISRKLYPW